MISKGLHDWTVVMAAEHEALPSNKLIIFENILKHFKLWIFHNITVFVYFLLNKYSISQHETLKSLLIPNL